MLKWNDETEGTLAAHQIWRIYRFVKQNKKKERMEMGVRVQQVSAKFTKSRLQHIASYHPHTTAAHCKLSPLYVYAE